MSFLEMIEWGIALLYFFVCARMLRDLRWSQRLPSFRNTLSPSSVSIVMPARDEGERIETSIRRLLAQRHVSIEIIVVNDRSTDNTAEVADRLAREDSRVKHIRIDTLPPGWLGKCHACHVGALSASGDWILFSDADCWLREDTIARALELAAEESADHVTLTPGVKPESASAAAWNLTFLLTIVDWIVRVNRDHPRGFLGIGAFNLVRASAYRACGGYEALRMTVVDDMKLGLLLRRAGFLTRARIGADDAVCNWGSTLLGMIKIMEKNFFAAIEFRTGAALTLSLGAIALWILAIHGVMSGSNSGTTAFAALMSFAIPGAIAARRIGWSMAPAILVPFIIPILFYAILNSTIVTLRNRGISWRGTFYPLADLRRGNVQ